ncbi:MAG TPA: Asp-tRNA(Asn)/Glu-tRNA(Gln) amidotransferase subunit GatB [Candidatus Sulfotelmatobacter sp.]|nr:Asp-tRNA(Asn)/Glu-tRNA(Gln) amidotransferase subunit GatB [Candidatus Sulfotelmatobacter sp.]
MLNAKVRSQYQPTIGIECHVQLKSKTKLFSGVDNDARSAPPNTLVSHICFGLPGALPVLNKEAVHLAARAAFALNSSPQKFSKFDRKHYFYPDLPMGYQITQYDEPIIIGGHVNIELSGKTKGVGITRAHLEADAGKSTHPEGKDYSLVDLNRAGTPLLEIVSEPDMHSAEEAKAYARELYLLMRYAGVSDTNLYYGNMRFDVNVSVSKDHKPGIRTETKNINSFRSVEKAVEYEIDRQIELIEKGQKIVQETKGWDDIKQKTFTQRTKENADDYRYMPDPDLPPLVLESDYIENIKKEMPLMPNQWRSKLASLGLDSDYVEILLDAEVEEGGVSYLSLIERTTSDPDLAKFITNWFVNLEIPRRREGGVSALKDSERWIIYEKVHQLFYEKKISSTNVKQILIKLIFDENVLPENFDEYLKTNNLTQISSENELEKIVDQVIAANTKAAEDVKKGEVKAIGFLVGQTMQASKGSANPNVAQEMIKKKLGL